MSIKWPHTMTNYNKTDMHSIISPYMLKFNHVLMTSLVKFPYFHSGVLLNNIKL